MELENQYEAIYNVETDKTDIISTKELIEHVNARLKELEARNIKYLISAINRKATI